MDHIKESNSPKIEKKNNLKILTIQNQSNLYFGTRFVVKGAMGKVKFIHKVIEPQLPLCDLLSLAARPGCQGEPAFG